MSQITYTCKQAACTVHETGLCLESLEPGECSHSIIQEVDTPSSSKDFEQVYSEEDEVVYLRSGKHFEEHELSLITHDVPIQLVLLLGAPNSGKTTLLASLFDQFQKNPVAGYNFAGSKTIYGFERRCHKARYSGIVGATPDTDRTSVMNPVYLHLCLRKKGNSIDSKHLIFTDVSGELYEQIQGQSKEMENFSLLRRADHICYLLDGESLTENGKRQRIKNRFKKFLERGIECNMVSKDKPISVLISRLDQCDRQKDSIKKFFIDPMAEKFKGYIKRVHYIASRSVKNPRIREGEGMDQWLLWLLEPSDSESISIHSKMNQSNRVFHSFRY